MMNTRSSRRISSRMASFSACVMVICRVCTCVCAIPHLLCVSVTTLVGWGWRTCPQTAPQGRGRASAARTPRPLQSPAYLRIYLINLRLRGHALGEQQRGMDDDGVALFPKLPFFIRAVGRPHNAAETEGVIEVPVSPTLDQRWPLAGPGACHGLGHH